VNPMADSWRFLMDPQTVTLHVYAADGDYTPQEVPSCQKAAPQATQNSDGEVVVPKDEAVFHLWAARLAGAVPRAQDVVEHAGERWTVRDVETLSHGARFKCHCVREA
jgi:hypothetical protein